jgi:hypothetical protein
LLHGRNHTKKLNCVEGLRIGSSSIFNKGRAKYRSSSTNCQQKVYALHRPSFGD